MTLLAHWEAISLRVNAAKVSELVRARVNRNISLAFERGRIRVTVAFVTVDVTSIEPEGDWLLVVVKKPLLVPAFVIEKGWAFVRDLLPYRDAIALRASSTFVVQVDRFLPPFVRAGIRSVRIDEGGLAVELGAGGITIGRNHGRDD
jgi:hypothetical protein